MTATAPTDNKKERIIRAAIDWVYNQSCSTALMELEDAVEDFFGIKREAANAAAIRALKDKP